MERDANIIVVGGGGIVIDRNVIKAVRGSLWHKADHRFFLMALISIGLHTGFVVYFHHVKIVPVKVKTIEEIPERFAKLIIERPIPKDMKKKAVLNTKSGTDQGHGRGEHPGHRVSGASGRSSNAVVKNTVARQVAQVEEKIRTVGVLGMLTGVGATAKGPSVVDVLGTVGNKKEHLQDLDKALAEMSGLQQTRSIDIMQKRLVNSKEVEISRKEGIDELIADIGSPKATDLSKKGTILISRPESIEGAASSSAKRDIMAINAVVASHKTSVRMSYERFLKKTPDLAGKITIRFTIDAAGNVTRLEVLENTTGNKELEDEIARKVKMWKFEAIPEGEVTITYPLVFQPAA